MLRGCPHLASFQRRLPVTTCCLLLLASLVLAARASGQSCTGCGTNVPANSVISNTTWTTGSSPYCVQGNITVNSLTIQPGVCVRLKPGAQILVQGRLNADGTAAAPITFTAELTPKSSNRWGGLSFQTVPPGSSLRHCRIEFANNSGIELVNSQSVIEDCLIADNTSPSHGGGLNAHGIAAGDLVLKRCRFERNASTGHGGGMRAELLAGVLRLEDCIFEENTANPANANTNLGVGGGVWIQTGASEIRNTFFRRNRANRRCDGCTVNGAGGGLYTNGDAVIENSIFQENLVQTTEAGAFGQALGRGGALYFAGSLLTIRNSILACNQLSVSGSSPLAQGGGLYLANGAALLENTTIARNQREGVFVASSALLAVNNAIVWENNNQGTQIVDQSGTAIVTYSCIQNSFPGMGNIAFNPQFIGLACECLVVDTFSPCIDSGDPMSQFDDACTFPAGPARGNARNDMGAHGGALACSWTPAAALDWELLGQPVVGGPPIGFGATAPWSELLNRSFVFLSRGSGSIPVPSSGGQSLNLALDATFLIWNQTPTLLRSVILCGAPGPSTFKVSIPSGVPVGSTFYYAGISIAAGGVVPSVTATKTFTTE